MAVMVWDQRMKSSASLTFDCCATSGLSDALCCLSDMRWGFSKLVSVICKMRLSSVRSGRLCSTKPTALASDLEWPGKSVLCLPARNPLGTSPQATWTYILQGTRNSLTDGQSFCFTELKSGFSCVPTCFLKTFPPSLSSSLLFLDDKTKSSSS